MRTIVLYQQQLQQAAHHLPLDLSTLILDHCPRTLPNLHACNMIFNQIADLAALAVQRLLRLLAPGVPSRIIRLSFPVRCAVVPSYRKIHFPKSIRAQLQTLPGSIHPARP